MFAYAFPAKVGPHFPTQKEWKAEDLRTTAVSRESAQTAYVSDIAAVNCWNRHVSLVVGVSS